MMGRAFHGDTLITIRDLPSVLLLATARLRIYGLSTCLVVVDVIVGANGVNAIIAS